MTEEQINALLARVRTWPRPRQDDAAAMLLAMEAQGPESYGLSDDERAEIDTALAEVERGEVASDEEVAAVFAKYRR